ncbi:MAG TPA: hypothetical protein VMK84_10345 [Streptosporangiaceae bacterium]|nr:hypothetical protein [Streptosporangiaceae bacterium]
MLTAMPFSGDRAVLAPCRDFRTIRVRRIAEDHTISNLVADAGLPALVLDGTSMASQIVRPIQACGIRGPATATCCALIDSARSQKTDLTFMYKLWAPHSPTRPGSWPS